MAKKGQTRSVIFAGPHDQGGGEEGRGVGALTHRLNHLRTNPSSRRSQPQQRPVRAPLERVLGVCWIVGQRYSRTRARLKAESVIRDCHLTGLALKAEG